MTFSVKVISRDMQHYVFSGNLNPLFKRNEDILIMFKRQNTLESLEYCSSLVQEFFFPARHFESGEGPGKSVLERRALGRS